VTPPYDNCSIAVAVDAAGDVIAAGDTIAKFRGSDGSVLSRRHLGDLGVGIGGIGYDIALTAGGEMIVGGGILGKVITNTLFGVSKIAGPVAGRKLTLRDKDGVPTRRKLAARARDHAIMVPRPDTVGDPRSGGAVLELINPTTGEKGSMPLPADNWEGLGRSAGYAGYRYRDKDQAAGPCRKVDIIPSRRLKVDCRGPGVPVSLDEPGGQGSLGLRLTMGNDTVPYCVLFGGTVTRDKPAVDGRTGLFKAKNALPPPSCLELGSPSGAFISATTDLFE
jgi:hypothetical protein